jgi:hypothetical protein
MEEDVHLDYSSATQNDELHHPAIAHTVERLSQWTRDDH